MLCWQGFLIVAALTAAATDTRPPDAAQIFRCDFEEADDADFDHWPDRWTRQRGAGYPRYLPMQIVHEGAAQGTAALKMDLDGGAAALHGPAMDVSPNFSYQLELSVKTSGLQHDRAFASVTFRDTQGKDVEHLNSELVRDAREWTRLRVGPFTPSNPEARSMIIGLHLEPGVKADLHGWAMFDDIWLGQLPRVTLTLNHPYHLYTDPRQVEMSCQVSGVYDKSPRLAWEIVNLQGEIVAKDERLLEAALPTPTSRTRGAERGPQPEVSGFRGSAKWRPDLKNTGFFRGRVRLSGQAGQLLVRELTLAVLDPKPTPSRGEFGWTVAELDSAKPMLQLLPHVGVNWVKFPVWFSEAQMPRLDQVVNVAERLGIQHIEAVGIMADPPAEVRPHLEDSQHVSAADIFSSEPKVWYPSLEPVLTRLSLQLKWWQIGADGDTSLVGYPKLAPTVAQVRKQLQQFGQEVHLGMGWRMLNELPTDPSPPWEFVTLSAQPQMTPEELSSYLATMAEDHTHRWVELEPLPRGQYTLETRASDLVHRMLAAKIQKADVISVPRPFHPQFGLMNPDGSPSELLLPWRTAALALAGSTYLGSVVLPQGSTNEIFARDGEVVMVAWNPSPVRETMYLGDNVRQTNIWGQPLARMDEGHEQSFEIGPLPTFITGINESIIRWNQSLAFEKTQLPSVFGVPHECSLVMKNFFGQGVGGQLRIQTPDVWKTYPRSINFKLAAGEEVRQPFTITLPFDATSGRQPVKIDVEVNADRHYHFTAYRYLDVGSDQVTINVTSHLNERGELEIEQRFTNRSDREVNFKCLLFAPQRRRQLSQVIRLGQDTDLKIYRLSNGRELVGKTLWLRAEETGGERILNYRFVAEE